MYVVDLDRDSGRWSPQLVKSPVMMVKMFDDAREVDELLCILQASAEHDELKSAFHRLEQLFSSVPKYLENSHVYAAVLSTMTHMETDLVLQEVGLHVLHTFMVNSSVMEDRMRKKANVFYHLLKLLSENPHEHKIQAGSLRLLVKLVESDHMRMQVSHLKHWLQLMDCLMVVVKCFMQDFELLQNSLKILTFILKYSSELQLYMSEKYLQPILMLFKSHSHHPDILKLLFQILHHAADSEKARSVMAVPVLNMVLDQLQRSQSDTSVIITCFCLIEHLCLCEKFRDSLVENDVIMRWVLPKIMSGTDEPNIQLYGLRIFYHAASQLFGHVTFEEAAVQWLKVIYIAMSRHMARSEIQACACQALSKLLECKPEVYVWIGESSEQKQDPIHTLCLGAILMYEKDVEVFTSACKSIYHLTADNESICRNLMQKNSHIAIIQGMRYHSTNPRAVSAACRAIRGLCIFQYKHKNSIARYDDDLLSLLADIIRNFVTDPEVQSEVISTIACLADIDLIRHQCFVVGMHLRILEAMDNYPGDEFLQEVSFEALAVLGGAASGSNILNSHGTIDKIIKCMQRFLYNGSIQKKGLCAIQILAEWQLVQSTVMCQELASIIKSTMKNYPTSLIIQKEAIVAMQILAEKGVQGDKRDQYSNMAEVLVEQECHELLFQILEKHEDDKSLRDLASECLYVLGIEQDLKSRMLRAACSRGYIAGAECLIEVGADVNIGQGTETPLYFAVSNNSESMVEFLLQYEVRDVLTSLKLSLTEGYHNITGMLLAHIGRDKETGTVVWTNLGLRDTRPEWLLPTLRGQNRPLVSSAASKRFAAQIIHSKQRRNRRLHYSSSDSSLEIFRYKCVRFPTVGSPDTQNVTFDPIQEFQGGSPRRPNTIPRMNDRKRIVEIKNKDMGDISMLPTIVIDDLSPCETIIPPPTDALLFETSEDEWEDWKQTTLTGANIPFSPNDPRRPANPTKADPTPPKLKVKWPRKLSSRDTHYTRGSSINSRIPLYVDSPGSGIQSSMSTLSSPSPQDQSSDTEASFSSRRSSLFSVMSAEDTDFDVSVDDHKGSKQQAHSICSLDMSANQISSLENLVISKVEVLHCFSKLEHLDLSSNELKVIPEDIFKALTSLRSLSLSHNSLSEFPASIGACAKLASLDLSFNLISSLSFESQESMLLMELNISRNKLKKFPSGLDKAYPHLTRLNISSNCIDILPSEACNLSDLRCLDISHNSIQILPDDFLRNCPKLELLIAVNNGLRVLPSETVAPYLPRLTSVKLNNNAITEKEPFYVPKFILELPNVRTVDLSCNGLVGFPPPSMWKTQMLKELMMSKNNITKLNLEGARHWSKLEKLHLSYNKIMELPREIGQLSSLQSLDLSHNKQLMTLPDELGRCSRLWEMPLEGLSLDLDVALTRGRIKDLTIYLHNRLKKAQRYYRMKLMVVGYGGRGKTSLLQALRKKLKNTASEKPAVTVGVIVEDWRYERQRYGRTVGYTLNTWDFAGQEDFYSTHQCFLSNRTLYLVVYDISMGTDEIDKLKPWLSNIQARAPGCPVIVVGTHYDLLPEDSREDVVTEFELKLKELVHKPGFPAISCFAIVGLNKETRELEQLRNKVKDIVDEFKIKGQPVMGQKVPASYVKLGDMLHDETKKVEKSFPVIRHSRLVRLIKLENLDLDEDELKQAVNFLHESGVLLHYNETTLQMRDFYFINPGWLCRMMAQVVTVPQINPFIDRNGVMKRSSVQMLFTGKETFGQTNFVFPSSLIPQYLHLLEKFEIALPRNEEELLIPCRLPNRKPNIEMPVQTRAELVMRYYVMPSTPIGFWSRLLTRLIVFSESKFAENMLYLQEKPQVQFWKEGIFVKWSQTAFFLVDSYKGTFDEIHLTVPNTAHGSRLMGYLIDHADSLVDEWYPGLATIDPTLGRELLEKFVPCTVCQGPQPHNFRFEDLLKASENDTEIYCPEHKGMVDLINLAPDVMLADVEPHFHLDLEQFDFKESPENLCGDGGFGSVYKAMYKGQVVAVKVFSAIGDIHPHKMLRQEATILRRLNHPSVVALVGVSLRPARLVVMEFAPNKSLGAVFKSGQHLSRMLMVKISQQIAEGLNYLHGLMVIYRDLKPDNVLVFTLVPDALINAKITDYGISQFTTLFGLTAQEGTPGYRAPEVIRGETYSFQADIFSLGILMYMVLSGGVHPFDGLEFSSEIDKAFAENLPVAPITKRGCPPWPDFQELVTQCLNQVPDYRPKAQEVFNRLSSAELFSLREVLPVSVRTTVECMATQQLDSKNIRLWVASGDNEYMQLSWVNLLDYRDDNLHPGRTRHSVDYSGMGTMFRDGRVLCILPLNKDYVLLGTQAGKIWVFSTITNELIHSSCLLQEPVLSLFLVQREYARTSPRRVDDPLILAGLANGKIALYPMSEILQEPTMDPMEMKLGESYEPIRCIMRCGLERKVIASCGTKVFVMDTRMGVAVENTFNTVEGSNPTSPSITTMACGRQLYLAHRGSNVLEAWDIARNRKKNTCNISDTFRLSNKDGRITSLVLHELKTLWVGTGGGHIVLIDVNNWTPIACTHRHTGSVRSMLSVRLKSPARYGPISSTCVILSGGLGFKNRSESDTDKDCQYGCIGVWDADFPQTVKQFSEWSRKRKELHETSRRLTA